MSDFEKMVIPSIGDNFIKLDFTDVSGFVGCYTEDPDRPSARNEFYIVYDDRKYNEYTQERCRRFETFKHLKKVYIKTINNIPYRVYSFYIDQHASKFYEDIVNLTPDDKLKIINFWSELDDISRSVLMQSVFSPNYRLKMECEDYVPDTDDSVTIKAGSLKKRDCQPFIFLNLIVYISDRLNHFTITAQMIVYRQKIFLRQIYQQIACQEVLLYF